MASKRSYQQVGSHCKSRNQNRKQKLYEYLPNKFIKVKNIQIIECLLAVPPTKYIEEIANFITTMSCSTSQIYNCKKEL
jgi:hypothetical protein